MSKFILAITIVVLSAGCKGNPTKSPESDVVSCTVIKFDSPGFIGDPPNVCAVECRWRGGYQGYASSTPVPCTWYGHKVTRQ